MEISEELLLVMAKVNSLCSYSILMSLSHRQKVIRCAYTSSSHAVGRY